MTVTSTTGKGGVTSSDQMLNINDLDPSSYLPSRIISSELRSTALAYLNNVQRVRENTDRLADCSPLYQEFLARC